MIAVDTSALLAVCLRERERNEFVDLLDGAERIIVSAGTMIEARLVAYNRGRSPLVDELDDLLTTFDIEVVPVDVGQIELAHSAFVTFGKGSGHPAQLNFGDLFSYALAKSRGVPLLYKGDGFSHTDIVRAQEINS